MVIGQSEELTYPFLTYMPLMNMTQAFYREIADVIAGNSKGLLIIGGDFNAVQNGSQYAQYFQNTGRGYLLFSLIKSSILRG